MTRVLYRCVIFLHPPAFRRRFADEMLWIFDEASTEGDTTIFLADGLVSLIRRWMVSPVVWKLIAMAIGSAPFLAFCFVPFTHRPPRNDISVLASPDFFLVAVLAPLITISIGLVFAVSCFRFVLRRRA